MYISKTDLDTLLALIIYGDIHEIPFNVLNDLIPDPTIRLDTEQLTRVSIAATVKRFLTRGLQNEKT